MSSTAILFTLFLLYYSHRPSSFFLRTESSLHQKDREEINTRLAALKSKIEIRESDDSLSPEALRNLIGTEGFSFGEFSLNEIELICARLKHQIPEGSEIGFSVFNDAKTGKLMFDQAFLLKKNLKTETIKINQLRANLTNADSFLSLEFNETDTEALKKISERNLKKRIFLTVQNIILTSPLIEEVTLNPLHKFMCNQPEMHFGLTTSYFK